MQTNLTRSRAHRVATLLVVGITFGSASFAVFAQEATTTATSSSRSPWPGSASFSSERRLRV